MGTTVVVGGDRGIGRGVAAGLAASGRRVVVLADASAGEAGLDTAGVVVEVDLTDPEAVRSALAGAAGDTALTTVVLAHLDPAGFRAVPLVELDEAAWEVAAERSLRAAFVVLQQAHAVVPDGARVVLVLPTVAASGAAGLVPLCTAVEGVRVMAKAVARRWGPRGITVNTVEVDLGAFMVGDGDGDGADADGASAVPAVSQLGVAALAPRSAVVDVVRLVDMLDSEAGEALTGALLVADRGTVMQP